jgi:hypothetical protein
METFLNDQGPTTTQRPSQDPHPRQGVHSHCNHCVPQQDQYSIDAKFAAALVDYSISIDEALSTDALGLAHSLKMSGKRTIATRIVGPDAWCK